MSLKDKTVVVTGGSRGLGLGLVEALVDQGAKVTVGHADQNHLGDEKAVAQIFARDGGIEKDAGTGGPPAGRDHLAEN
jgi:NAD(P)-dependent dehydrogenase (short-subunit alcohol dehydrogenase family)